ncbi:hypothetical protein L345_16923 [Ophiophagus hannah]|uniref:Uncharacterized protein n=1 Tax=Ophiophagus hannah TaxID=8665 RepID=V8N6S3_OPHHA|nr:hypothetical protein L345_16923 [Ophiophagus hannah]
MAVKWRVVKAVGTGLGIFAGSLLVFQLWPSDEVRSAKIRKDFQGSSQNYLDSQRQNALFMEILKEAATTDENWARKPFPSKK